MIRVAAYQTVQRNARKWRRGCAGKLALLAMLLYALSPFALPETAAAQLLVEICTAHGIVTVTLPDANGSPAAPGMPDCPACALAAHGSSLPAIPQNVAISAPITIALATPKPCDRSLGNGVAVSAHRSRGPPRPV